MNRISPSGLYPANILQPPPTIPPTLSLYAPVSTHHSAVLSSHLSNYSSPPPPLRHRHCLQHLSLHLLFLPYHRRASDSAKRASIFDTASTIWDRDSVWLRQLRQSLQQQLSNLEAVVAAAAAAVVAAAAAATVGANSKRAMKRR